jgi:hypothetical protein
LYWASEGGRAVVLTNPDQVLILFHAIADDERVRDVEALVADVDWLGAVTRGDLVREYPGAYAA